MVVVWEEIKDRDFKHYRRS